MDYQNKVQASSSSSAGNCGSTDMMSSSGTWLPTLIAWLQLAKLQCSFASAEYLDALLPYVISGAHFTGCNLLSPLLIHGVTPASSRKLWSLGPSDLHHPPGTFHPPVTVKKINWIRWPIWCMCSYTLTYVSSSTYVDYVPIKSVIVLLTNNHTINNWGSNEGFSPKVLEKG